MLWAQFNIGNKICWPETDKLNIKTELSSIQPLYISLLIGSVQPLIFILGYYSNPSQTLDIIQ
jgi:hypothetical protein